LHKLPKVSLSQTCGSFFINNLERLGFHSDCFIDYITNTKVVSYTKSCYIYQAAVKLYGNSNKDDVEISNYAFRRMDSPISFLYGIMCTNMSLNYEDEVLSRICFGFCSHKFSDYVNNTLKYLDISCFREIGNHFVLNGLEVPYYNNNVVDKKEIKKIILIQDKFKFITGGMCNVVIHEDYVLNLFQYVIEAPKSVSM
jgi:hypothetical protein